MFAFDNSYARELDGTYVPAVPSTPPRPTLVAFNEELAVALGLDAQALRAQAAELLSGAVVPEGATPIAQAYAGHQFGGLSPQLGDGRAHLLGELFDAEGRRRDLQLKGSGRTPFSRGGDGKAALGPMLREFVMGEAMHALGIPTSRALAVVSTGEKVYRETPLQGAVLARVAASHLRIGTFEFFAIRRDTAALTQLVDYALRRHHPEARADSPALALLTAVRDAQARLVARWMGVGFIHGVMNTDNVTISGETIDYGPCAFMDAHDPDTVFSSIDHGGRYAYGNQPTIMGWNLARLASALLPAMNPDDPEAAIPAAQEVLSGWTSRYREAWLAGMRDKLGLVQSHADDEALIDAFADLLQRHQPDHTLAFRHLAAAARGDRAPLLGLVEDPAPLDAWVGRWLSRLALDGPLDARADAMDRVNPLYIARNHAVEAALKAANEGDLVPFERLVDVLRAPYDAREGLASYAQPAPAAFTACYQTFCGT